MAWMLSNELKGRSLREVIHEGISIQFDCDTCGHRAVWPWPQMLKEEKLQPYMHKQIHELAVKVHCMSCGQQDFHARPYIPRSAIRPTRH